MDDRGNMFHAPPGSSISMGLRIRVPKSQSEPAADQGHHGGVGVGGAAAGVGTKDYICGTSLGAGSSCGDGNDADADADAAPFSQTSMVRIADVKTFSGFLADIPGSVNIHEYNTVVVWCETFSQYFSSGQYR